MRKSKIVTFYQRYDSWNKDSYSEETAKKLIEEKFDSWLEKNEDVQIISANYRHEVYPDNPSSDNSGSGFLELVVVCLTNEK